MRGVEVGRVSEHQRRRRARADCELAHRSRPDPVHPGQRGGTDSGHHRIRRQVRRPGVSGRSEPGAACRRRGAAVGERQHRGQHDLPERVRPARDDRPGEAERGADRGRRGCPRSGRADGRGHHRPERGADRPQRAQRHHPAGLAVVQELQRHLRRRRRPTSSRSSTAPAPPSATVVDHASDLDDLLLNAIGLSHFGYRPARVQQGQPRRLGQHAGTDDQPAACKYNPVYTCWLQGATWFLDNGGFDVWGGGDGRSHPTRCRTAVGQRPLRLSREPAGHRGQGRSRRTSPGCGSLPDATKNFPVRQAHYEHRVGDRAWTSGRTQASAIPAGPTSSR